MPTVTGLYMNIIPPLVYIVFGTVRHGSIGNYYTTLVTWNSIFVVALGAVTLLALMMGDVRYRLLPCEDCWTTNNDSKVGHFIQNFSDYNKAEFVPSLTPIEIGCTMAFLMGIILVRFFLFMFSNYI